MKTPSLKWRLLLPVFAALVSLAAVIVFLAYDTFAELLITQTDHTLMMAEQSVQVVMGDSAYSVDRSAQVRHILASLFPVKINTHRDDGDDEDDEGASMVTVIWPDAGGDGKITIGPDEGVAAIERKILELDRPAPGQTLSFNVSTPGDSYRGVWVNMQHAAGPLNIVIARSMTNLVGELHELLWDIILSVVVVLGCTVALSGIFIMIGLQPIHRIAKSLEGVTAGNLGRNIEAGNWLISSVPSELEPFVRTVREMLDRLHRSLQKQKTFVADASHDLRTPLAVAKSTVQVALTSSALSRDECHQALQEVEDDLQRIETLVEELLLLARFDDEDIRSDFEKLDLSALVREVADTCISRVSATGGHVYVETVPAFVSGDEGQLRRLFLNLLDNALIHGPAGGDIHVCTRCRDGMVEAIVKDEGGDIPPEKLPHVFDRFYRADSSRAHTTGGAGLGLAIAQAIALRHGGVLAIQSEPSTGTLVCLRLPGQT